MEIPAPLRRILLIRLSALGDVINTLPAVSALHDALPGVRLGYVVEERCADIVRGHPFLERIHVFPRRQWQRALARPWRWPALRREIAAYLADIRSQGYDAVLDFQANLKGGVHAWLSRISVRVGFARGHGNEGNWIFSNVRVAPPSEQINRVEKYLSLLAPLGVSSSRARYEIPRSDESRRRVEEFLRSLGWTRGGYVLIHPGTSEFGRIKRWPPDRFAALAKRLGGPVLVAWGPGERELAESIAREAGPPARVAMETRSLLDLAELIAGARSFVGADSGPLHLASAVGVPSVALFGPKDPRVYGPWNPRGRVVYKPNGHGRATMDSITVDDALEAVRSLEAR